jgi:hypothetical protein
MATINTGVSPAADPDSSGLVLARADGPAADGSNRRLARPGRLVLAAARSPSGTSTVGWQCASTDTAASSAALQFPEPPRRRISSLTWPGVETRGGHVATSRTPATGSTNPDPWVSCALDHNLRTPPSPGTPGNVPPGEDLALNIGWDRFEKLVLAIGQRVLGLRGVKFRRYGVEGQAQHGLTLLAASQTDVIRSSSARTSRPLAQRACARPSRSSPVAGGRSTPTS